MQIRVRLTLQFIMIAAGILLAAFVYIHFQFKLNLENEYYDSLKSKAFLIAEMVAGDKTSEAEFALNHEDEDSTAIKGTYPENVSIYTMEGKRLYSFNPAPQDIRPFAFQDVRDFGECRFDHGHFNALGILYFNKAGQEYIVVAESVFDTVHIDNLTRILIVVFLISISLVAIGGWFFARQALAPVSRIMNEVDAILPTDMSHRLVTTNQHDELSRLVITFNKLLDRIQKVFRLQKMFLSNISHELKNPLNVIISQVEITLQKERSLEEYKATLSSVLSDTKELNEVADKLMQLARINADDATVAFQPIRIDEVIWQARETLLKNHPEYKVHAQVTNLPEEEAKLLVDGNDHLLKTALINLMDNGCKYSPDKAVRISLSFTAGGMAGIEIADQGPGIPRDELPLIFNAFYRSPRTASVKGSGIGLSLVDSILKLHHITLEVKSLEGKGTTLFLKFPPKNGDVLLPTPPIEKS